MAFFSRKKSNKEIKSGNAVSQIAGGVKSDASGIIIAPRITEKAMRISSHGAYMFRVAAHATKIEIRKSVERMYGVHVEQVQVINVGGKHITVGRHRGRTSDWRKAIVTLKKGQTINI